MRIVFAIPGDLSTRSGGYGYDRAVLAQTPKLGVEMAHLALPRSFPFPGEVDIAATGESLRAALRPGDVLLIDGLAYGALPEATIRAIPTPIVALCHHPLCLETGLSDRDAANLFASEKTALALAEKIVVTSALTAEDLKRNFAIPEGKIAIAIPGTEAGFRAPRCGQPPVILALGALIARKGYDVLLEALGGLTDLSWRLRIGGSTRAAPEFAEKLFDRAAQADLAGRVEFLGEVSAADVRRLFAGSDLFVSASYYEGYGMAMAEALSFGLPIVASRGGAADTTLPDDAALKVTPGDAPGLRAALRLALTDAGLATRLAEASWQAGQNLPDWRDTARIVVEAARKAQNVSFSPSRL